MNKVMFYRHIKPPLTNTDLLALGRNQSANERTLLAYVRTFLSFIVAGISLIQFFALKPAIFFGYVLIPAGFIILLTGIRRFLEVKKSLNRIAGS
jgi:putative membrane protein